MFKKAIILLAVLLLASSVFSVRLIDPISKELAPSDNFVGTVAVGNSIELIFSKELTNPYQSLSVLTPLPEGFSADVKYEKESIKLFISVPKGAPLGDYPFSVRLFGPERDDTVDAYFTVVSGALKVSPSSIVEQKVPVGSPAVYKFFFENDSDGSAVFTLTDSLPPNWNQDNLFAVSQPSMQVVVPKRQSLEASFTVYPRLQGKKQFSVNVSFENTSLPFSFFVNGVPTLKSKLSAVSLGLPFYSFSLLPGYFLDGIASFWMK